jgi:DNA-binding NarL/FixJ family response regulator
MVSVLLAGHALESDAAVRATLEADRMTVCGSAADLPGAIAAASRARPDLCLLDAALAGARYSHVPSILAAAPPMRVVILDGFAGDAELLDAVSVGAAGHLPQHLPAAALSAALRDVLAGRPAFPRRVEALLAAALRGGS